MKLQTSRLLVDALETATMRKAMADPERVINQATRKLVRQLRKKYGAREVHAGMSDAVEGERRDGGLLDGA